MNVYPAEVIAQMRAWVADCVWADLDPADVAELTDEQVVRGVRKHFDGGLAAFMATCN